MSKRKKKKNPENYLNIESSNLSIFDFTENNVVEKSVQISSSYETTLLKAIEQCKQTIVETKYQLEQKESQLLQDYEFYQRLKMSSNKIRQEIYSEPIFNEVEPSKTKEDFVLFDFENNLFYSGQPLLMPTCHVGQDKNLHICNDKGIYINSTLYSSAKLFSAGKSKVDSDTFYIKSFEIILDNIVSEYECFQKYAYLCMLPEAIDIFNTKVRRCLNTSKGKIISIPKSVALSYYCLDYLSVGDRYCVINLDGPHPIITHLSIGKDESGKKVIQREGIIQNNMFTYNIHNFYSDYLNHYESKYSIKLTDFERDRIISNKQLQIIFDSKTTLFIFREAQKISIRFDEEIFRKCIDKYRPNFQKLQSKYNYKHILVATAIPYRYSGQNEIILDSGSAFFGLTKIKTLLQENKDTIIWIEMLPKISLEVIDDTTGRFKTISLIDETAGQKINLSLDQEYEVNSPGNITLQKGKKEYFLPLEREIFSEDINSDKEAHFYHESFPLNEDLNVDLIVKYNYLSDSPITIYARPKSKNTKIKEFANKWVNPHEIKLYDGPIYNGHPKEIQRINDRGAFSLVQASLVNFVKGNTLLDLTNFQQNVAGETYHRDLLPVERMFRFVRIFFDSNNYNNPIFAIDYDRFQIDSFLQKVALALDFDEKQTFFANYERNQYSSKSIVNYKKGLNRLVSDIIVACWYYKKTDHVINHVYESLANCNQIKVLIRLSRCILRKIDDKYQVFETLTTKLHDFLLASKSNNYSFSSQSAEYIRTLSSNCWFNEKWIYLFYDTKHGPLVVEYLIKIISSYLKSNNLGSDKKYRDVMEFLVCLTRLKTQNRDLLNPNNEDTKELLKSVKSSYEQVYSKLDSKKLQSRLETESNIQVNLFGYPNYIYMLIVTLSGEGQVNLVGYHDD